MPVSMVVSSRLKALKALKEKLKYLQGPIWGFFTLRGQFVCLFFSSN